MSSQELPAGAEALAPHQRDFLADILASEFYRWCGVEVLEIGGEESRLRFRPRSEMLAPWGTLNGSLLNALLELPSFLALLPKLEAEEGAVTNDIFIQQLRAVPGDAEVTLRGRLLRRSRSMAWTEAEARVEDRLCATARITKSVVPTPR
ncbi:MAG: PaaI family thioesterase [Myxococcales bacterium]|nr:PaaI family thioesterase [Myxococcales bacterium]